MATAAPLPPLALSAPFSGPGATALLPGCFLPSWARNGELCRITPSPFMLCHGDACHGIHILFLYTFPHMGPSDLHYLVGVPPTSSSPALTRGLLPIQGFGPQ